MRHSQWSSTSGNGRVDGRRGSAIVVVLLFLVALTVLGLLGIDSSMLELQLVYNSTEGRKSFYLAESAVLEGIQRLVDTAELDKEEKISPWHHSRADINASGIDFRQPDAWHTDGGGDDNALRSSVHESLYIAAVEWRLATGSSAVVTASRLYMNRIYGLCSRHGHNFIVEVGYYSRY